MAKLDGWFSSWHRRELEASAGQSLRRDQRRLADFDEMAVGVAHVAAEPDTPVCRRARNSAPRARHCS
jgi:hypothetical protein